MKVLTPAALKTGSLRLRTVVAVLLMLVILLGAVGVTIEAVLGERLRTQIEQRLADSATAAASLIGTVSNDDLAQRLSVQGLSVRIRTADGQSVEAGPSRTQLRDKGNLRGDAARNRPSKQAAPTADGPVADPAPDPVADPAAGPAPDLVPATLGPATIASSTISADENIITLVSRLSDGATLTLAASSSSVTDALEQLRLVMIVAGAAFLAIAAVCLVFVTAITLRPLDQMTRVARSISAGNRGRRLNPRNRSTEIGRVALAFDEMLDSIEGAEQTALDAETRVRAFVSDAAHELRTPIAGMLAAAETLVRNPVGSDAGTGRGGGGGDGGPGNTEEQERLAAHIAREAGRASRLVDNMLTMARVDRGLELSTRPVELRALIRADAERHALPHPQLKIVLDLPETPVTLVADSERISQVVNNLVDNASHATGGVGQVIIALKTSATELSITVVDSGPGVPETDRERIFDRFVRLDVSRNNSGGGAGLGLPIARGIAEAHGGTLRCEGARFVVTLPLSML